MDASKNIPANIDDYILSFPEPVQQMLQELRETIRRTAPEATECISYNMPAFKYHGMLVYFAGYKNHIGFYPTASGIRAFEGKLSHYPVSKGTVRFPLNELLPLDLIREMVDFRVQENLIKKSKKK